MHRRVVLAVSTSLLLLLMLAGLLEFARRSSSSVDDWSESVRHSIARLDDPRWTVRRRGQAELSRLGPDALARLRDGLRERASANQIARLEWLLRTAHLPRRNVALRLEDGRRVEALVVRDGDGWLALRDGVAAAYASDEVVALETTDLIVPVASRRETMDEARERDALSWLALLSTAVTLEERRAAASRFVTRGGEAHLTWLDERLELLEAAGDTELETSRWLEWARRELHWRLYGVYE